MNSVADPEECEGEGFEACEGNELTEDPMLSGEKSSAVTEVAKDTSPQDKVNFPPVRGMNNPLVCCLCNKGMLDDEAAVSCRNEQCSNHGHAACAGYTKRDASRVTSFCCPACKVFPKVPLNRLSPPHSRRG